MGSMRIQRVWAMPCADTFDCPPIGDLVKRYLRDSKVSIDPFARNKRWATYTNDLNPATQAEYHMDALDFLWTMVAKRVKPDLIIFDPPYSPTQIKQCYDDFGLGRKYEGGEENWVKERDCIGELITLGGVILTFGWNTGGMGKARACTIEEILLVCHGAAHNDTICMAERKVAHQGTLPEPNPEVRKE